VAEDLPGLSEKQKVVLGFIERVLAAGRPFPSLSEIGEFMDVSRNTAKFHIQALERKGYIEKREERVSAFKLAKDETEDKSSFPWAGGIAAGYAEEVYEEPGKQVNFGQDYFGKGDFKVVTVNGNSMLGDAICDGDLAVIAVQKTFRKNDVVAVRVTGEGVTLKRLKREGKNMQLIPSNDDFHIKTVPAEDIEVLGKFVGLVRKT
jgi:repressor LexA